jgi:hypothetical protein
MELPELVSNERDYRMLEARKAGANYREIGKMFNVSPSTAHNGVKRALKRESSRYVEEHENAGWLVMERYDTMLKDLMPFTKPQKVVDPDTGKETRIPPSYDAIDRVLKVIDAQRKMLGLDQDSLSIEVGHSSPVIENEDADAEMSSEEFAKKMLSELIRNKAFAGDDAEVLSAIIGQKVIDAEVVEDGDEPEMPELDAVHVPSLVQGREMSSEEEPPEWVDEDDEEYQPGEWIPPQMGDVTELE